MTAFHTFAALGTTVVVGATDPARLDQAVAAVRAEVEACDLACSRFRHDSELSRLNAGETGPASPWFCEAVAVALEAARTTNGLVDPTIGQCLIDLGYDRTFASLETGRPFTVTATHVPAWSKVTVEVLRHSVRIPAGVRLDLGATAKALCADRAAARASAEAGVGVLVSLGGDIAVGGAAPEGGWTIRVTDRCDRPGPGQDIAIRTGGVATSGISARRWSRGGEELHHLVDPRTARPAAEAWRTVSVAAPSCVAANTASTAAMVMGSSAPSWLEERSIDARLVRPDGSAVLTGGWPADTAAASGEVAA